MLVIIVLAACCWCKVQKTLAAKKAVEVTQPLKKDKKLKAMKAMKAMKAVKVTQPVRKDNKTMTVTHLVVHMPLTVHSLQDTSKTKLTGPAISMIIDYSGKAVSKKMKVIDYSGKAVSKKAMKK